MFDQPAQPKPSPPPPTTPILAGNAAVTNDPERRRSLLNRGAPSQTNQGLSTRASTGKRTLIGGS